MYETINKSLFKSRFKDYGRVGPNKNFSYRGLDVLFEYLENLEQDLGEQIELDVIALCCDYSELTFNELKTEYSHLFDYSELDKDDVNSHLEVVRDHTTILEVEHHDSESTYIVAVF